MRMIRGRTKKMFRNRAENAENDEIGEKLEPHIFTELNMKNAAGFGLGGQKSRNYDDGNTAEKCEEGKRLCANLRGKNASHVQTAKSPPPPLILSSPWFASERVHLPWNLCPPCRQATSRQDFTSSTFQKRDSCRWGVQAGKMFRKGFTSLLVGPCDGFGLEDIKLQLSWIWSEMLKMGSKKTREKSCFKSFELEVGAGKRTFHKKMAMGRM